MGLNLAEALDSIPQQVHFRAGAAFLLSFTRLGSVGLRYLKSGATADKAAGEVVVLRIEAMVALHEGRWAAAAESAAQAVMQSRAQKDDFALMYSLLQQQLALIELDDFAQVLPVSREMEQLATRAQNPRYIVLGQIGQIAAYLRWGELPRAEQLFARAQSSRELGPVIEAALHGLGAMCALHQEGWQLARQLADIAMEAVRRVRWPLLQLRYALIGVLDVYLSEELADIPPVPTKQALAMLRWIGREFAVARSTEAFYRGLYELRHQRWTSARSLLQQSLRAAQKYGVRYDQAQAHYWLGRLAQAAPAAFPDHTIAIAHLRAALTLFQRLRAAWDVDRVNKTLRTAEIAAATPLSLPADLAGGSA